VLSDSRWDMTYLGMQVLIEVWRWPRSHHPRPGAEPARRGGHAYVMQDEARHVAFGRLTLRDYYPQLTQKERDEREEFRGRGVLRHARSVRGRGGVGRRSACRSRSAPRTCSTRSS